MSSVPSEIPDIGSTGQKLRQSPSFDPMRAGISTEEYFVWSRFDGLTSLRDLILMTGFAPERAVEIVRRLRGLGAIVLPGESVATTAGRAAPVGVAAPRAATAPAAARPPSRHDTEPPTIPRARAVDPDQAPTAPRVRPVEHEPATAPRTTHRSQTAPPPPSSHAELALDPAALTADERAAFAEAADVAEPERLRILALYRAVATVEPWTLLGIAEGADKKEVKRAYFRLSKDLHPDRYYGKRLGRLGPMLSSVFEALSRAYTTLADGRPARTARESPGHGSGAAVQAAQTPVEYAAELFERACSTEVGGDAVGALRLFDASIRVDPQSRYLRRAANCALTAGQIRVGEEYAKKAANLDPTDPSTARLLARAFKVAGKLGDAEEVLVMAMAFKIDNDVLASELRADLVELRRLLPKGH